jgi:hypothetical protein
LLMFVSRRLRDDINEQRQRWQLIA